MPDTSLTITPDVFLTSNIQMEDVRRFMLDNLTDSNVLGTELYFMDEEMKDAMKRAVDEYNAIPPLHITMTYGDLRLNHIFLNGIAYQLCLSKMMQLQRKDVEYSSSTNSVAIVRKQIEHLNLMKNEFKQEFKESTMVQKRSVNIHSSFRTFL